MVYNFFDKKSAKGCNAMITNKFSFESAIKQNEQVAEELHKPIITKVKKRKVYSSFKDNISGVDLADMQLISKFNNEICFLLCVIDILGNVWCIVHQNLIRYIPLRIKSV